MLYICSPTRLDRGIPETEVAARGSPADEAEAADALDATAAEQLRTKESVVFMTSLNGAAIINF
jgi:hypothetical protein